MPQPDGVLAGFDRFPTDRGWSDFARSPLGHLAAFIALAAVGLTAALPSDALPTGVRLGQLVLVFIALGCTAVLAFRDQPTR